MTITICTHPQRCTDTDKLNAVGAIVAAYVEGEKGAGMTFYQWHQDLDAFCLANFRKASHCFADDAELLAAYDDGVTAADMFRRIWVRQ